MPPNLLNDDGTASMATAFLMSHHGLRRDLARFAVALEPVAKGDAARAEALGEEWKRYHETLHGHHDVEDQRMFPGMKTEHASLATVIDGLAADHARIGPLLERGDRAFADLPARAGEAAAVVAELRTLLDSHLATEETHLVPLLRGFRDFPAPQSEAEAVMYADGFAWSSHGIAPDVLTLVYDMLPPIVTSGLPKATGVYADRCLRVWGFVGQGASRTSIPDPD